MPSFDTEAFMSVLTRVAEAQGKDMKDVAAETGVSEATLSRMKTGKRICDAASLAALSLWAGVNPAKYSGLILPKRYGDTENKIADQRLCAAPPAASPLPTAWCRTCGKWAGAHAVLPGQPTDHLCMCRKN